MHYYYVSSGSIPTWKIEMDAIQKQSLLALISPTAYYANTGSSAQQSSNGVAPILVCADRTCFLRRPLTVFVSTFQTQTTWRRQKWARCRVQCYTYTPAGGCIHWTESIPLFSLPYCHRTVLDRYSNRFLLLLAHKYFHHYITLWEVHSSNFIPLCWRNCKRKTERSKLMQLVVCIKNVIHYSTTAVKLNSDFMAKLKKVHFFTIIRVIFQIIFTLMTQW